MTDPEAGVAKSRLGRAMETLLTLYAAAIFVLLWVYVAAAVLTAGELLTDTWSWLSGFDTIVAVFVWIAILPVAVFLWAWQADLEPVVMGLVMLGLVAWTAMAASALLRWRRSRLSRMSPLA